MTGKFIRFRRLWVYIGFVVLNRFVLSLQVVFCISRLLNIHNTPFSHNFLTILTKHASSYKSKDDAIYT